MNATLSVCLALWRGVVARRARLAVVACVSLAAVACSHDEVTAVFSTKHLVRCDLMCVQNSELQGLVGNFGRFVSIRQRGEEVRVNDVPYPVSAEQMRYFSLGLGGLIAGANYEGELRAYDLACPNCDRADRRLSVADDGTARCQSDNCRIRYDLNHDGVIMEKPAGCVHDKPRGLYRYQISFDGQYLHIHN